MKIIYKEKYCAVIFIHMPLHYVICQIQRRQTHGYFNDDKN